MSSTNLLSEEKLIGLAQLSLLASESGIRSAFQLSVFLSCGRAQDNNLPVGGIFSLDSETAEYKRYYAAVRQLMGGAAYRGHNGTELLVWGEKVSRYEKAVLLSPEGKHLFESMQALMLD